MEHNVQRTDQDQVVEPVMSITDQAVKMIKQILESQSGHALGVRMSVSGSGCKGYQYSLNREDTARSDDTVSVQEGIALYLDPISARHMRGTRLDYVTNRHGTGFYFFGLDVERSIGCGSPILLRGCIKNNTRTEGCVQCAQRPLMELDVNLKVDFVDSRQSISHPGLKPMQKCEKCMYVVCQCDKEAA